MKPGGVPSTPASSAKRPVSPVSSESSRRAASIGVSPLSSSPPTGSHVPSRLWRMRRTAPRLRAKIATEKARRGGGAGWGSSSTGAVEGLTQHCTFAYKGTCHDAGPGPLQRHPEGTPRAPGPEDRRGREGLRRRHPREARADRVRDAGGDALPASLQAPACGAPRLRVGRVGGGAAAQVLPAHGQGEGMARRAEPVLEVAPRDGGRDRRLVMQKVVNVSLHGNAYVLEEEGYAALRAYLDEAERQLASDPDRAEILGDLEQAIAEKCSRQLGPH